MSARRGVALVLFLLFLAVMASAAGLMVVAIMFSGPPAPKVSSNSTLFLRVQAPFPEIESISVLSPFVTAPPTLRTVVAAIDKARHDDRIRGMVVIPNTGGAMWAQLQELHEAMAAFRTSGKSLVVFMEYGGSGDYYLASAAERVLMMPAGTLDVSGLATYELFFRGALDKLGVYPDLLHMGEFKSYSNTFTEKGFTPAHREMTRSLNRDAYDQLVAAIAKGRNKSVDEIRRLIDEGPFLPEEAKAAGLIDDVAYDDQIDDASPVQGTRRLESADYLRGFEAGVGTGPRIALLYAVGTIASGNSTFDAPGGTVLGSDTFVDWIRKVRADSSIRAIVIRIDSPGGSAIASEVIWRELMLTRQVKPVIVSMGDVAASGGYYMAVPANAIVAEPGTITGSIGVVTGKFVLKGTMDKLGVGTDSVSDGKNAEIYSPFRPFTPPERAKMEAQMQSTYELFVSRVAEGRRSSSEKIDAIAKGRVWTGKQARELGLVDELGGLDRAIALAKEHAKLDISKPVTLVVYPQKRSVFELFANPLGVGLGTSLEILTNRPEARVLDRMAERLRLFRRGETLALMPNLFYTGALTPVERFPLTHQSVLERIRSGDATVRHGAFSDLITGYWRPSYHYLRLHWRLPADEAEDVIQGFFTVAFEKGYLEKFDPAKARFRTFLRTCLDRFLQNQRKAETALKRGGSTEILSLDFPGAELEMSLVSTDLRDLDQFFRDEIIRALFARAVDELRDAFTQEGKARAFEAFERHDLSDDEGRSDGNVASAMGVPVTTVTNDLHTARTRFREIALVHLRALVGSDEEYRQEARQLFGVEVALD